MGEPYRFLKRYHPPPPPHPFPRCSVFNGVKKSFSVQRCRTKLVHHRNQFPGIMAGCKRPIRLQHFGPAFRARPLLLLRRYGEHDFKKKKKIETIQAYIYDMIYFISSYIDSEQKSSWDAMCLQTFPPSLMSSAYMYVPTQNLRNWKTNFPVESRSPEY